MLSLVQLSWVQLPGEHLVMDEALFFGEYVSTQRGVRPLALAGFSRGYQKILHTHKPKESWRDPTQVL